MKRRIQLLAFCILTGIQAFSQIVYEKGYFVNESGERTGCLIRNVDWKSNPTGFEYKLTPDGQAQKASIETVKEFGVEGASRFVRRTVQIDRSPWEANRLSSDRHPKFSTEQLFLKVLIEGKATLYFYRDANLVRFFYKVDDSEVKQLVSRRYLVEEAIEVDNSFRQQLFIDLKCRSIGVEDLEGLRYDKRELMPLFIEFNECSNSEYVSYEVNKKKDLFNLSLRPGLNYSGLSMTTSDLQEVDFDKEFGFRFGVETEFILPYNKNKWAIIAEPTYQSFTAVNSSEASVVGGIRIGEADYQSIEIPVGVRHYFFLNGRSKLFADVSYMFDFDTNSSVTFRRNDGSVLYALEVKTRSNIAFGAGYKYGDRYSLSMRYQTGREILSDYLGWSSRYKTLSVIFGYSLM